MKNTYPIQKVMLSLISDQITSHLTSDLINDVFVYGCKYDISFSLSSLLYDVIRQIYLRYEQNYAPYNMIFRAQNILSMSTGNWSINWIKFKSHVIMVRFHLSKDIGYITLVISGSSLPVDLEMISSIYESLCNLLANLGEFEYDNSIILGVHTEGVDARSGMRPCKSTYCFVIYMKNEQSICNNSSMPTIELRYMNNAQEYIYDNDCIVLR